MHGERAGAFSRVSKLTAMNVARFSESMLSTKKEMWLLIEMMLLLLLPLVVMPAPMLILLYHLLRPSPPLPQRVGLQPLLRCAPSPSQPVMTSRMPL